MATAQKSIDDILAEVGLEVGYVMKAGKNSAQNYKYARAEDVLKKVNEALFSRGCSTSSNAHLIKFNVTQYEKESQYGTKVMFRTDAAVRIELTVHFKGETRVFAGLGSATDTGDKAVFKANTGALKYLLANAFLISWGDDPEADEKVDIEAKTATVKKRAPAEKKAAPKKEAGEAAPSW